MAVPLYLQWLALVLHFGAALALYSVLWRCDAGRYTQRTYREVRLDWQDWMARGAPGAFDTGCNSTGECYRDAQPWVVDDPEPWSTWNPYVLGVSFEWLSGTFAAFRLYDAGARRHLAPIVALDALGYVLLTAWGASHSWGILEALFVLAAFFLAPLAMLFERMARHDFEAVFSELDSGERTPVNGRLWRMPKSGAQSDPQTAAMLARIIERLRIIGRYLEYSVTASLLYLCVLFLFSVGPPTWAIYIGAAGVVACNLFGLPLHLVHLEIAEGEGLASQDVVPAGQRSVAHDDLDYMTRYDARMQADKATGRLTAVAGFLGLARWRHHYAAEIHLLQAAWTGLAVALLVVLYLGAGVLINPGLPWVVVTVLWQLILLYSSFGIVATVCYARESWWRYLETALAVLDLAAKIPVAVIACVSFTVMPGGSC